MNVVEKDGKVRLVVSNKARSPGLMVRGEEHPYPRGVAGIVFINDEGTESATLTTHTRRAGGEFGAYSGLRFGSFGQGQNVGMLYDDDNGQREAGLFITDPPTTPTSQLFERGRAVQRMAEGPAKARAMAELRRAEGAKRVTVARLKDQSAAVELSDAHGKPRLRLVVDPAGAPRLDFLDASGRVTRTLSGSAEAPPR
ncbi:MAG: hypothetical protein ACREON_07715 [Gemmatimonadaceae bacterium]